MGNYPSFFMPFFISKSHNIYIEMMDWNTYYKENKHIGTINEVVAQYNMYVYQNEEQYDVELIRKMGSNSNFILQEEPYNYIILQEGKNEYGILQEY